MGNLELKFIVSEIKDLLGGLNSKLATSDKKVTNFQTYQ